MSTMEPASVQDLSPALETSKGHDATAGVAVASWLCRVGILIHALGMVATVFATRQTQFNNLLFMQYDWAYTSAVAFEKVTVSIFLAAAVVTLFWPTWPLLLAIAGYVFLEAWCSYHLASYRYSDWAIGAQSLRYTLPLALLLLVSFRHWTWLNRWRSRFAELLLRVAIAVVFATHGWQCLDGSPRFVDLIIGSSANLLGVRPTEATALLMMQAIAYLDFVVAAVILFYPVWPVLLWAAFWGALTAASRVTTLGLNEHPEVLLRAAHVTGPLAALWLVRSRVQAKRAKAERQAQSAAA